MTKSEYREKRNALISYMEPLSHLSDPESGKLFDAKMAEVKRLDEEWEKWVVASADVRDMSTEPPAIDVTRMKGIDTKECVTVEGMDFRSGRTWYGSGAAIDHTFLAKGETMVDRVTEKNGDSFRLLNTPGALGDTVRGIVTGKWESQELKNAVTTSASGVLIPEVLSAQILDLMRNNCLFTAAGCPVVPMETNNLTVARVAQDPTFTFKEEGQEGAEAALSFDSVELKAKTLYGYCYVSLEALKSAKNLDAIIRTSFAQAMGVALDAGILYGQKNQGGTYDSFAPDGIWNNEDVESVALGSDTVYDAMLKGRGKLLGNNAAPSCIAVNAATDELLQLQKDGEERYLPMPAALSQMNTIVSNQLAYDESAGSDGLIFDPSAILIGLQNGITVEVLNDTECVKKGLVAFRVYCMADAVVTRPKAVCKLTGLK